MPEISISLPRHEAEDVLPKATTTGMAPLAPADNAPLKILRRSPETGTPQHKRPISAINSRTSSSRVAQLVQKRTVLWEASSRRR